MTKEEASLIYLEEQIAEGDTCTPKVRPAIVKAFAAGAEWQKEQFPWAKVPDGDGKVSWLTGSDGVVMAMMSGAAILTANLNAFGKAGTDKQVLSTVQKLRAVLKGAEVIEMPSEEDMEKMLPDADCNDELASGACIGWRDCFRWIESKIVK